MRADKDRIDVQRQRQHHHGVDRARRKGDHQIGHRQRQQQPPHATNIAAADDTRERPNAAPK